MVGIMLFRKRNKQTSILDLPFAEYDRQTGLPKEIRIGESLVTPFVSIDELRDHLTLLAAFHKVATTTPNLPRFCDRAAAEYQRWAQVVLPRSQQRRRSSRRQSSLGTLASPTSPILSKGNNPITAPVLSASPVSSPISIRPPDITPSSSTSSSPRIPQITGSPRSLSPDPTSPAVADADVDAPQTPSSPIRKRSTSPRTSRSEEFEPGEMPTLGIVMCWHAHMLNPRVYALECEGAYRALRGRKFPLRQIAHAIRTYSLPTELEYTGMDGSFYLEVTKWDQLDIAAAIQRQMKFVVNMERIGWLAPDAWDKDIAPLQRGNVRYHAWLDLMHSTANQHFLVPTLDIDLAWHTHQLRGLNYQLHTEKVLGWFLGHDDNAGDNKIGDGLVVTGKLWKKRFGYNYTF